MRRLKQLRIGPDQISYKLNQNRDPRHYHSGTMFMVFHSFVLVVAAQCLRQIKRTVGEKMAAALPPLMYVRPVVCFVKLAPLSVEIQTPETPRAMINVSSLQSTEKK